MEQWRGKTALITGAGTGIGRALALELANRGSIVYVTALEQEQAQQVVDTIVSGGGHAVAATLDVTDKSSLAAMVQRVASEQGQLDLMINNAGLLYVGEFLEIGEAFLDQIIEVNFKAVSFGTLYGLRQMKQQGFGTIVNIASQGGLMPVGAMAAYAGTKHGVVGLSSSVAAEAEADGVIVKTVCPGNVASDLIASAQTRGTTSDKVLEGLPTPISAERAASIIVGGLASKKRQIVFPWYTSILVFVQRMWPGFGHRSALYFIEQFRSGRSQDNQL